MIIDSFTFYNEFDLLEFRLKLLYDLVDKFVIVEADHTFSGKPKSFNFEREAARFDWAKDKIVYHKAALNTEGLALTEKPTAYDPKSAHFQLEYQQRNALAEACAGFADEDVVMMSDVDEMPAREVVAFARGDQARQIMPFVCDQKLFYYTLDHLVPVPWYGTIVTTVGRLKEETPQRLRSRRTSLGRVNGGGWHLSYFGDTDFIMNKIASFAHQEFNNENIRNAGHIERCVRQGIDPFGQNITFVRAPRDIFPGYFLKAAMENETFFFAPMPA